MLFLRPKKITNAKKTDQEAIPQGQVRAVS